MSETTAAVNVSDVRRTISQTIGDLDILLVELRLDKKSARGAKRDALILIVDRAFRCREQMLDLSIQITGYVQMCLETTEEDDDDDDDVADSENYE